MRVVVPYAGSVHPITRATLADLAPETEFVDVSADDFAYANTFRRLWEDREGFLLIEHDIQPTAGAIAEAGECRCPWSFNSYVYQRDRASGQAASKLLLALGFVRFSADLLRDLPDAGRQIREFRGVRGAAVWSSLDSAVEITLHRAGYVHHLHADEVGHHHWWPYEAICSCGARTREICETGRHHVGLECLDHYSSAPGTPAHERLLAVPEHLRGAWREQAEREAAHNRFESEAALQRAHVDELQRRQEAERRGPWAVATVLTRQRAEHESLYATGPGAGRDRGWSG